ncbi:MAG: mechanosensitive ion channel family protein [Chloroflexota bacterium]|nr:mechanosensitive ion channel family protein [Chloroflexota bacterium]
MDIGIDDFLNFAGRAAVALTLILALLAIARRIKQRVAGAGALALRDPAVAALVSNLVYVGVIALGVGTILPAVGVNLTAVVTALGVTGLAISLALQDVLRNFVAGIYVLLEKPFNIGDRIALRDLTGEVQGIELRTTLLRTSSGAQIIVPNSVLMTDIVTNRSLGDLQAYSISVCGDRQLGKDGLGAFAAMLQGRADVASEPEPEVLVESVEADKTTLRLRFHARQRSTVVPELVEEIESRVPGATVTARIEEA